MSHTYSSEAVFQVFVNLYDINVIPLDAANIAITVQNTVISNGGFIDPSICGNSDGQVIIGGIGNGNLSWTGTNPGNILSYNLGDVIPSLMAGTYDFIPF